MHNARTDPDRLPANELSQSIEDIVPDPVKMAELRPLVLDALATVYDPEIPVNIKELGLIYDVLVDKDGRVGVRMTLDRSGLPGGADPAGRGARQGRGRARASPSAKVEIVWEPPWDKDRMSEAAKLQLGMW